MIIACLLWRIPIHLREHTSLEPFAFFCILHSALHFPLCCISPCTTRDKQAIIVFVSGIVFLLEAYPKRSYVTFCFFRFLSFSCRICHVVFGSNTMENRAKEKGVL